MTKSRTAGTDWLALAEPVAQRGAVPLRVAVYTALAAAIRSGDPEPGSLLPFEAELCGAFGVSRTVMREALLLLEEDGLIRSRRGIGRFVVDQLPEIGLEQLQPVERLLQADGVPATVKALRREEEGTTDFTARGLDLPAGGSAWIWESQTLRRGQPIALSQEWVPAGAPLAALSPKLAAELPRTAKSGSTLLARVNEILGPALGPGSCEISISTAGSERGGLFGATARTPILLLSQTVLFEGRPLYLAKHMIRAEAGHILITQSAQS